MNLPEGLLSIDEETFAQDPAIQKVMIAEGTRVIGPGAFSGCTGLSEITLPASLERIGETAFEGCGQLRTVHAVPFTPACRWALEKGLDVLETGTGRPLTPFTFDEKLSGTLAAQSASQIVLVEYHIGSQASLSVHEKRQGIWTELWETAALVGRNGIGKTREGDRRTPAGTFSLTAPFGILPDPGAKVTYLQVTERHYWCGTSGDPYYNRLVDETESGRPCLPSDERLTDFSPQYNYCMFIGYNEQGEPGKGSCIFLHCRDQDDDYTEGCVAVSQVKMMEIIRWAEPGAVIVIR